MPWRRMGEWRYSSNIVHICTRWTGVVNLMTRLLYPRGKSRRYPLDRGVGGLRGRSGHCGVEKNLFPLQAIESWPPVQYPVDIPTELSEMVRLTRYFWMIISVKFGFLMAVTINNTIFKDVTPYILVGFYWSFGRTCWLHLQGLRVRPASRQTAGSNHFLIA
jgi:hypothetical protein